MTIRKEYSILSILAASTALFAAGPVIIVNETGKEINIISKRIADFGTNNFSGPGGILRAGESTAQPPFEPIQSIRSMPNNPQLFESFKNNPDTKNDVYEIRVAYTGIGALKQQVLSINDILGQIEKCAGSKVGTKAIVKLRSGYLYGFTPVIECGY